MWKPRKNCWASKSYASRWIKNKNDLIIVQDFIEKVQISGVVFTNDINSNAPYYLINYDESGKTNLVTSGKKSLTHKQYTKAFI